MLPRTSEKIQCNVYCTSRLSDRREKKQFEQYQKAMKTMPDKKEREEIEALKIQVRFSMLYSEG